MRSDRLSDRIVSQTFRIGLYQAEGERRVDDRQPITHTRATDGRIAEQRVRLLDDLIEAHSPNRWPVNDRGLGVNNYLQLRIALRW